MNVGTAAVSSAVNAEASKGKKIVTGESSNSVRVIRRRNTGYGCFYDESTGSMTYNVSFNIINFFNYLYSPL